MSGYSFQIILQHIKLKGRAGKNNSEICVPGSQQTQEWETSAPSSHRTPEARAPVPLFNHRNVGTQNPPLRHYSGGPIFRHFPHFNPGAPNSSPILPQDLGVWVPSSLLPQGLRKLGSHLHPPPSKTP